MSRFFLACSLPQPSNTPPLACVHHPPAPQVPPGRSPDGRARFSSIKTLFQNEVSPPKKTSSPLEALPRKISPSSLGSPPCIPPAPNKKAPRWAGGSSHLSKDAFLESVEFFEKSLEFSIFEVCKTLNFQRFHATSNQNGAFNWHLHGFTDSQQISCG